MTVKELAIKLEMSDKHMWEFIYDHNSHTCGEEKHVYVQNNDDELSDKELEELMSSWHWMYECELPSLCELVERERERQEREKEVLLKEGADRAKRFRTRCNNVPRMGVSLPCCE